MNKEELWKRAADFHGHVCGGLAIGFNAALYAMELLDKKFSDDEEIVCIAENDSCSIDAIQAVLGCSIGKGNLLFHMTGKQVYTFFDRKSGKSFRISLKKKPGGLTKEESFHYYLDTAPSDLFHLSEAKLQLPEQARIFDSYVCDSCGEIAGANWIRLVGDKKLCTDCYVAYDRFHV